MTETSLIVIAPLLAAVAAALLPSRALGVGFAATLAHLVLSVMLATGIYGNDGGQLAIGGWPTPLGIALYVDGLAALMLVMNGLVGLAVTMHAAGSPSTTRTGFWPLWLLTLAALNGLYLTSDFFNMYVAFEILGLAAVGLTILSGKTRALRAGFDYLCAGLAGSLLVLLGVVLAYAAVDRVDLAAVPMMLATAEGQLALALILVGLAVKAALFPLHFWMPEAHSGAVSAASAILSALVVKGALYVMLRVSLAGEGELVLLQLAVATFGGAAMIWGAWRALTADRLKLLVAYSTVAQVGLISVAIGLTRDPASSAVWQAAAILMLSHALAKAAMFLAVGRIAEELGHDRISGLNRSDLRPSVSEFAFAIAAISLIGLPPTAGFVGKWILMEEMIGVGGWPWVVLLLAGTAMSVAYLVRVVSRCLRGGPHMAPNARVPALRAGDVAALLLALSALALGALSALPFDLLNGSIT
ncbi:MAG: proton-conducting transporter membrane subunit [Pseudomonadota bacterium]